MNRRPEGYPAPAVRRNARKARKAGNNGRRPRRKAANPHPLRQALLDRLGGLLEPARKRRWNPMMLAVCSILMSWDPSPHLAERFEAAGASLSLLFPRRRQGRTYQGYIKALLHQPDLHRRVGALLRLRMRAIAGIHWQREGFAAFAADGSKVNCPRTRANEAAFGHGGKGNGPPQQLLTTLWHMGLGLPWSWESGPVDRASEREHLRRMLPLLPLEALLVADAGFVGYELMRRILKSRRHFLIRVGRNVHLLSRLGLEVEERPDRVYLWPAQPHRGGDHGRERWRRRQRPLALRLIRIPQSGHSDLCLLTDLGVERLSFQQASVLYRMRWGVELFYRGLKQQLQHRKLCSAAPRQARREPHWAVVGVWVLGLLSVEAVLAAGHDPLSWSLAGAVRALRRSMRRGAGGQEPLEQALATRLKDGYVRKGPKSIRPYPRKRKQAPPGEPDVRPAAAEEVALAQSIYGKQEVL